jgi:hypothetical protein
MGGGNRAAILPPGGETAPAGLTQPFLLIRPGLTGSITKIRTMLTPFPIREHGRAEDQVNAQEGSSKRLQRMNLALEMGKNLL